MPAVGVGRLVTTVSAGITATALLLAEVPPLPILLAAGFLLGFFWGPFNPLMTTLVQDRVPADEQGRVFGVQLSVFYAAPPLGMIIVGYTVEIWGVATTYLVLAGTLAITSITVLFARSVRQLPASRLS
ncbi:MAG: MFS transporter [Actinomycetales bacterium]